MDKEVPLFNLKIKLEDWQGPFKNFTEFQRISQLAKKFESLHGGLFYVCPGGELKRGSFNGIHTYEGSIKLDSYLPIHMHYGKKREIADIFDKNDKFYLGNIAAYPVYTLEGLYSKLPNQRMGTKINSLVQELEKNSSFNVQSFLKNSLSTKKETRLKLLENK